MHIRPTHGVSAADLGLDLDNADLPLQPCDWQQIARLGLSRADVVEFYGEPPARFRSLFAFSAVHLPSQRRQVATRSKAAPARAKSRA